MQSGSKSLLILNLSNYRARGNVTMNGGATASVFGGSLNVGKKLTLNNGSTFNTNGTNVTIAEDFEVYNSKLNAIGGEYNINGDMNTTNSDITFTEVNTTINGGVNVSGGDIKTSGGKLG